MYLKQTNNYAKLLYLCKIYADIVRIYYQHRNTHTNTNEQYNIRVIHIRYKQNKENA